MESLIQIMAWLLIFFVFTFMNFYIEILIAFQKFGMDEILSEYEYIIVGSGTAGSVVMNGISSRSVLMIEAGVYHDSGLLDIPVFTPALLKSSYDWNYYTVNQKHGCFGLKDNKSYWPRGKVFGGSHILNNMIYHRGYPEDYNDWFGDPLEYSYDHGILPFFKVTEAYQHVSEPKYTTILSDVFIKAGNDFFIDNPFMKPNLTQKNGKRWTTSHQNYDNLRDGHKILTNSLVTKILFNDSIAIGVEYYSNGKYHNVLSKYGVILAAGTIETPKLLMLSGIGIKKDLEELNINVIADLPVGLNLQDHVTTGMDILLLNQTLETYPLNLISFKKLFNYYVKGSGPLTHGGCDAIGFIKLNNRSVTPDISYLVLPFGLSTDKGVHFRKIVNIKDELWENYFKHFQNSATVLPILLHPKSKGYIKLKSKNPLDLPIINPNYLSHKDDLKDLVKSLKILTKFLDVGSIRSNKYNLNIEINPKPLPNCKNHNFGSDIYWECYVKHLTLTMYHPVGTCRLGNNSKDSVVSNRNFNVHNIDNLYVIDGSILPRLPSGNPNAVISMLAEKFLFNLNKNINF